jgi:hypothetical protein
VLRWHDENPGDWLATWRRIEEKWQDNMDCEPDIKANINADLNGAYVVVGLLYGDGDMGKTIETATRCGQDSDCNPSNAGGVLGCMKGFNGIPPEWTSGIAAIKDKKFSFTDYSFETLISACQRVMEEIVVRAGVNVDPDAYLIPRQTPSPPRKLEQWTKDQSGIFKP